jgi:hypothetical protein
VLAADPNAPTVTVLNFSPDTTPPPGQGTDTFTAGAPGEGSITYSLTNGDASITFTFKYKIVAPPAP